MKVKINEDIKKYIVGSLAALVLIAAALGGAIADRLFVIAPLDSFFPRTGMSSSLTSEQTILKEENVVINVADEVSPSVVTVAVKLPQRRILEFSPFGGFQRREEGGERDIGSGFVVNENGLVVTNKHVVSNTEAEYSIITQDGTEYKVTDIARDPNNDIAVLSTEARGLKPVELGDSENLKVGQFVIAIGTALGEFRHTVTTGVISGLGRGITAGSFYEGFVERIDNVIQTDAAINPGNSGGPLLNSAGQVIGVNVAVAQGAENVGFAIPISVVKDALAEFNETGGFASRPYLGVEFQMISRQTALLNEVPQGALVVNVVSNSPAAQAGIRANDIITKLDGQNLTEENDLASRIAEKKVGDTAILEIWRNGEIVQTSATLSQFSE